MEFFSATTNQNNTDNATAILGEFRLSGPAAEDRPYTPAAADSLLDMHLVTGTVWR